MSDSQSKKPEFKPAEAAAGCGCLSVIAVVVGVTCMSTTPATQTAGDATTKEGSLTDQAKAMEAVLGQPAPPLFHEWAACREVVADRLKDTGDEPFYPSVFGKPLSNFVTRRSATEVRCHNVASLARAKQGPTCARFDITIRNLGDKWETLTVDDWETWPMVTTDCDDRPPKTR